MTMTVFGWLRLVVVVSALVAVTGVAPGGARHVAHTNLLAIARVALTIVLLGLLYVALRTHAGA